MAEISRTVSDASNNPIVEKAVPDSATGMPPIEAELEALWSELLGMSRIGWDETFLRLGGESLLAMQVFARVQERYGIEVPLRAIFVGTINSLAGEIRSRLRT